MANTKGQRAPALAKRPAKKDSGWATEGSMQRKGQDFADDMASNPDHSPEEMDRVYQIHRDLDSIRGERSAKYIESRKNPRKARKRIPQ